MSVVYTDALNTSANTFNIKLQIYYITINITEPYHTLVKHDIFSPVFEGNISFSLKNYYHMF